MYQRQFQGLQPQTTAHLVQTMTLLNMNLENLQIEIERAINDNPALVIEERWYCPNCHRRLAQNQVCPVCSRPKDNSTDEVVVFLSPRKDFSPQGDGSQEEYFSDSVLGSETLSLEEYVLQQISLEIDRDEKPIAAYVLNQLDDDGFFMETRESLASYFHVSLEKIDKILSVIQRADPIGVGSANAIEAIQIQLKILHEQGKIPDIFLDIANNHLEDLLKKRFQKIATSLQISIEEIEKISTFFSENLNPFPARSHWGTFRQPPENKKEQLSNPDVIIRFLNNDKNLPVIVEIVTPNYGNLIVNPLYAQAIKDSKKATKEKLREDFNRANLFIKCIQQRNNTMLRLMQLLVDKQKLFIKEGNKFLLPITRVQISKEMEVHESTISRAVANKVVQLPNGQIIPMSIFFDRSLGIRTELVEIINHEDKSKPFSDSDLVKELEKRGHEIARRTVAKYRALEGVLPAHQRRSLKK